MKVFKYYNYSIICIISVVFMGSKKYPDENEFDVFIKKHGGSDNACTDCERVNNCVVIITVTVVYKKQNKTKTKKQKKTLIKEILQYTTYVFMM